MENGLLSSRGNTTTALNSGRGNDNFHKKRDIINI